MVSPWRRKNCGRKITKPKINVLIVISTQEPTIRRCSSGGLSMSDAATCATGAGTTTLGSGFPAEDSVSIARLRASAFPARRFRQILAQVQDDQRACAGDNKHRPPSESWDDEIAEQGSRRKARHHQK